MSKNIVEFNKVFGGFDSDTCYGGSWSGSDTHEPDLIYKGNDVVGVWCEKCGITYLKDTKKFKKKEIKFPDNVTEEDKSKYFGRHFDVAEEVKDVSTGKL